MDELHYIHNEEKEEFNLGEFFQTLKKSGDKVTYEKRETSIFNIKTGKFETKEAHIFTIDKEWNGKW